MTALPKPMLIPAAAEDRDLSSSGTPPAYSTAQFWLSEIESRNSDNSQLKELVAQPWFESMLRAPGGGKLWGRSGSRRVLKELSESYSVLLKLKQNVDCSECGAHDLFRRLLRERLYDSDAQFCSPVSAVCPCAPTDGLFAGRRS